MKLCPRCGAVHDGHRWVPEPPAELRQRVEDSRHARQLCPGDLRLEKRQVEGVLTLKGAFLAAHREEVANLVNRVARRARERNVAARVFEITSDDEGMTVETTDAHLAERMGKEIEKAFKGTLDIKWQHKDTFARVTWRRE